MGRATSSRKSLLVTLALSVSTRDGINRAPIEHVSAIPVAVQPSKPLGLHEVLWGLE